jgi:AcrR family transcriptional regulator
LLCDQQAQTINTMSDCPERHSQAERRSRSEDALLDAAAELIAERGVQGASLASIGGRAGVSRGLPSHHFGSKDALVARLAQRGQDHIGRVMEKVLLRHVSRTGHLSALDQVSLTVDSYLELFEHPSGEERALLVMWGSTFPSRSSVDGMMEAERRSYEGLSQLIASGQEDGSIRADIDPTAAAVLLLGLMRGVASLQLTDSAVTDMRSVRKTCQDWISSALEAGADRRGSSKSEARRARQVQKPSRPSR